MLFTDGEVVMAFANEQSAEQNGFCEKIQVNEIVNNFIEWYAVPYEYADYGDKVSELAGDYAECIRHWLRNNIDIDLPFARTAIGELWLAIAGKMEQDSRFKKVTTFVYA